MSVWLLVAKGSLRHRIEKLGLEKADSERTELQRLLREAAQAAAQEADEQPPENPPERPKWAKGAFVYLTRGDAKRVPKAIAETQVELQSKHILISSSLRRIVKMALAASPDLPGREGFLLRRAGAIDTEEEIKLASNETCEAQEDGSPIDGALPDQGASSAVAGQDALSQTDDFGPVKKHKNVRLVQCNPALMEDENVKDVDLDLLEYLTSPPSVQTLDPDMWMLVWKEVRKENNWIEMREDQKSGLCPYCTLCGRWAEVTHLLSAKCSTKVTTRNKSHGPILTEILEAEQKRIQLQREHWDRVHAEQASTSAASAEPSAAASSAASPPHQVDEPFVSHNPFNDAERSKMPYSPECTKQRTPHRPPPPPPPPPRPRPPPPQPPPPPTKVDKSINQADMRESDYWDTDHAYDRHNAWRQAEWQWDWQDEHQEHWQDNWQEDRESDDPW